MYKYKFKQVFFIIWMAICSFFYQSASFADAPEKKDQPTGLLIPIYTTLTRDVVQPIVDLKKAHPDLPIRVVLNYNEDDALYDKHVRVIKKLQKLGIEVAGRIDTDFNKKSEEDVKAEIDLWIGFYQPDGVFFDSFGSDQKYYANLKKYAKINGLKFIIGNAGQNVDTHYTQLVDTVVIADGPLLPNLNDYCNWQHTHTPKSAVALWAYDVQDLSDEFIQAAKKFAGWIYVSDAKGTQPWAKTSAYLAPLATALSAPIFNGHVGTIIPFYIYPTQAAIQPLLDAHAAHPNVPMVVIMNPNSGVGTSINQDYVNAINQLKAAGISVSGYVWTNYGGRSSTAVKNEIKTWNSWYHPNGIFLDGMALNHSYYSGITTYAKSLGLQYVVGNPGSNIDPSAGNDVDIVVVFEGSALPDVTQFSNWRAVYGREKISLLVYGISALPTTYIQNASQTFGWMYITDDILPNPWDTLPPYFADLISLLDTLL